MEVGDLKPLIAADGIIVKLIGETADLFLISPQTLQDIRDSNHPHYTSGDSGKVKGAQMGKSIPVITLDIKGLTGLSNQQDTANSKAGVKDAQYIFEGEELGGIPKLLLEQINYTLTKGGIRPADSYDLWNIQLRGNYSTEMESNQRAEYLIRNVDSYHQIYHAYVGRPFPITNSSDYSAVTDEIDIRKDTATAMSNAVKDKKEIEQQQIKEIKEREKQLIEESKQEEKDIKVSSNVTAFEKIGRNIDPHIIKDLIVLLKFAFIKEIPDNDDMPMSEDMQHQYQELQCYNQQFVLP
jgi:hypothetical protein